MQQGPYTTTPPSALVAHLKLKLRRYEAWRRTKSGISSVASGPAAWRRAAQSGARQRPVALAAEGDEKTIAAAVAAARQAQARWAATPSTARGTILTDAAGVLLSRAEEVARDQIARQPPSLPTEEPKDVDGSTNLPAGLGERLALLAGQSCHPRYRTPSFTPRVSRSASSV